MADKSLQALTSAVYQIAENSPKIQKDVKDIRDAICGPEGILKTLMTISESIAPKKDDKDKLVKLDNKSDKISISNSKQLVKKTSSIESILGKILARVEKIQGGNGGGRLGKSSVKIDDKDDPNKKKKSLEGLSKAINIIERLRDVKLKDLLFAKLKLSRIKSIMGKFKNIFTSFKDKKELDGTISVANSSIEITEKLSKIGSGQRAKLGVKTIEKIILGKKGKGGILGIYKKLEEEKKAVKNGPKTIKEISKSCGSMLLTTVSLTAIGLLSIPAMAGALLMKGVIWLLVGTYKYLANPKRYYHIIKGSKALLKISVSVIAFALGLTIMSKYAKDVNFKSIGMLMATALGMSLTTWLIGKLGRPVRKGSISLVFVGAGLLLFSLGVGALASATKGLTLKDVLMMTALVGGMGVGVALLGLLSVPIALGSAVLLLLGTSLLFFALPMLIWKRLDVRSSMGNIQLAVEGLRETFGLELGKNGDEGKSIGQRLGEGLMGFTMALLEGGKAFFIMGTIMLAGVAMGMLYLTLKPWENYTGAKKAIGNLKVAIDGLKEVFGFEDTKADSFGDGLAKIGGGLLDMAVTLFQSGKALIYMGTIALATAISDLIRVTLIPWENYNGKKAFGNLKIAIDGLRDLFGITDPKVDGVGGAIAAIGGGLLDMAVTLFQSGKALIYMGTIALATAVSDLIRVTLIPWEKYNAKPAMKNMRIAIEGLKDIFGIKDVGGIGGKLEALGGGILDMGIALLQSGKVLVQMGVITIVTGMTDVIRLCLSKWDNYDPTKALQRVGQTVTSLKTLFGLEDNDSSLVGKLGDLAGGLLDMGTTLLNSGSTLMKIGTITLCVGMMDKIKEDLKGWENYTGADTAIANIDNAVSKLLNVFGLNQVKKEEESWWDSTWIGKGVNAIGSVVKGTFDFIGGAFDALGSSAQSAATNIKMAGLATALKMADSLKQSLTPWTSFNPDTAISNLTKSITGIFGVSDYIKVMDSDPKYIFKGGFINYFKNSTYKIKEGINNLRFGLLDSLNLRTSVNSFERVVKSVNNIDLEKATIVSDIFKSFSKLGTNTFDKFTESVSKFSKSCADLIEALNNFGPLNVSETTDENGETVTQVTTSSNTNAQELAEAITMALRSMPINVRANMSDVRLVVNNETGRRVVLTLDN